MSASVHAGIYPQSRHPPEQTPPWEQSRPPGPDTPPGPTTPDQIPPSRHPPGSRHSPDQIPPPGTRTPPPPPPAVKQTPAYGQRAAGTHPTGMHSCTIKNYKNKISYCHLMNTTTLFLPMTAVSITYIDLHILMVAFILERKRRRFRSVALFPICVSILQR